MWALRSWIRFVPPVHSGSPTRRGPAPAREPAGAPAADEASPPARPSPVESSWPAGAAQTQRLQVPSEVRKRSSGRAQGRLAPAERQQVGRPVQPDGALLRAEQPEGLLAQHAGAGPGWVTRIPRGDGEGGGAERARGTGQRREGAAGGSQQAPARQPAITHRQL